MADNKNYIVYHLHTELSLLDSVTNYKLYIDKAKQLNQNAICFTEHGNIYNWVEKKMYCDKNNVKYMHGVEMYLTETLDEKVRDNYHTVLIAKNYEGVKEINNLINLSTQKDHFYYKNRISFDEFLNISDNIISTSACLASPLARLDESNKYYDKLCKKYDYYEIQYHNNADQIIFNKILYKLSIKYNKPLIAGSDTHAIDNYKQECRAILQKAKNIVYSDEDSYDLTYKSYDEFVNMFKIQNALPQNIYLQAINNTNIMADMVESFDLDLSFKYPILYDNELEVLIKRIKDKYKYKIKNKIITKDEIYVKNIKEELKVFKKIGMIGFMLFMSELTTWARENNIPFGYCRGSVGGSTIAYLLDITDVNPIKWNTVFSRFANISRREIGDIDLDFSPTQRQLIYDYIIDRFGQDYTSYILAIGTVSDKGTIDEIGRALGYPVSEVARIKKEYETDSISARKRYSKLFYYFDGILGTAVSQSMHPAGIIASPITLVDNYGTFWSDGKRILCINMEEVHEVSLVKYDILGLKNVEIIKDTCELIGERYPLAHEMNWDDKEVWEDIITSPVGIFQFEKDYAFSLLKRYKPYKINDMSVVNAGLRPSGDSYRDRLIKREINKNPSEEIDELLKDNNGFLIFQEDSIKFLTDICGFDGSEADNVRRAIGRKDKDRLNEAMPKILKGYCDKSSKPKKQAEREAKQFLQILKDSSDYQFGYNHSTGYSMIGYTCGYYRYYYPIEFTTAYLNNADNEDDIVNGTKLASLKGITIKPIQFRHSQADYSFNKSDNIIYKGMASIKYMNAEISNKLYELRDNKYDNFISALSDIKNTGIDARQLSILIKLNFFREFGKTGKLLELVIIYNKLSNAKVLAKDTLFKNKLDKYEDIIVQYSRQTERQYRDLDNDRIMYEIIDRVNNYDLDIDILLLAQKEYLGYINVDLLDKVPTNYCIVESISLRYETPFLRLKSLKGNSFDVKIARRIYDYSIAEGDLLRVNQIIKKHRYLPPTIDEDGNKDFKINKDKPKIIHILKYDIINDYTVKKQQVKNKG